MKQVRAGLIQRFKHAVVVPPEPLPLNQRVAAIFTKAPVGVWQDYSLGNGFLFQDSAGTIPVTALAQPVGLALDLSKGFGPEQAKSPLDPSWTVPANMVADATGFQFIEAPTGTIATIPINITDKGTSQLTFKISGRTTGRLRMHMAGATTSFSSSSYTANGNYTRIVTLANATAFPNLLRVEAYTTDGSLTNLRVEISLRDIPGYHEAQSVAGSRSLLRQDAQGFYYRQFDGVDDFGTIPAFDMTMTDKARVYAGIILDNGTNGAAIVELSASSAGNPGSWGGIAAAGSNKLTWTSTGTVSASVDANTNFVLGTKYVFKGLVDIGNSLTALQINNLTQAESNVSLGTGNLGKYPMYIGARAGTLFPFQGRIYSMLVVGGNITPEENATLIEYVNSKTGAF